MPKIVRETDDIQFEFKTKQSTGVMMYIKGFHRDYIHVGLRRGNVIYCHIDLGTGVGRVEFVSPRVSDDQWHQVHISREDRNITLRFDGVIVGKKYLHLHWSTHVDVNSVRILMSLRFGYIRPEWRGVIHGIPQVSGRRNPSRSCCQRRVVASQSCWRCIALCKEFSVHVTLHARAKHE